MQSSLTSETLPKLELLSYFLADVSMRRESWIKQKEEESLMPLHAQTDEIQKSQSSAQRQHRSERACLHIACKKVSEFSDALQTLLQVLFCSTSSKCLFKFKGVDWVKASKLWLWRVHIIHTSLPLANHTQNGGGEERERLERAFSLNNKRSEETSGLSSEWITNIQ